MSFLNLPINRPAALVRLPPRLSQVAASGPHTPSAVTTDDERASEMSSSVGANMTASISTLATTVETGDTEAAAARAAEILKAEEKKKRKAVLAKEKRKRKKAKQAAEKAAGKTVNENEEVSEGEEEEDDPSSEQLRRDSIASASASVFGPNSSEPPLASTSKPTTDWASMTAEDEAESVQVDSEARASPIPTGPRAHMNRFPSDPSITPRLGKFWGHDERAQDRKGKQPHSSAFSVSGLSSANGSRRGSLSLEQDRAASPALSSGSGWQKVSGRGGKRNAFGMPTNGITHQNQHYQQQEASSWKHDRFEDGPPTQPRSWQPQQTTYSNFANKPNSESDDGAFHRNVPISTRPFEPPWTARSPVPYLFNEPGSRTVIDDETGKRKITLRICLKPVPALLENGSKKMARQRANIMELSCFLHFDEEWPRPAHEPLPEDTIFIIRLHPSSSAVKLYTPAGELKRKQKEELVRLEAIRVAEIAEAGAEAKRARDEILAQERNKEKAKVERHLAEAAAQRRSHSSMGVLYTAAPTLDEPESARIPTPVRSLVGQAPVAASLHTPTVRENSSPSLGYEEQMHSQITYQQDLQTQQQFMYGPPPGQPFMGQDGLPYILDPSTGHILLFHSGYQALLPPHMSGYPGQASPQYHGEQIVHAPSPSQSPPISTHAPTFFTPPKSHRLEIRAPSAGDVEKRMPTRKPPHKSHLSSSTHRQSPLSHSHQNHESEHLHQFNHQQQHYQQAQNIEEQYIIPGSYTDASGVVHFLPPNYNLYAQQPQPMTFFPPPPLYAPSNPAGFQDPAILSIGNEMNQ